jgi:hypothetical protein
MLAAIGIDIGQQGGISVISDERGLLYLSSLSFRGITKSETKTAYANTRIEHTLSVFEGGLSTAKTYGVGIDEITVFLETIYTPPGKFGNGMVSFGRSAGAFYGYAVARGLAVRTISPQSWKKYLCLTGSEKDASIAKAKDLYRGASLLPTGKSRKDSDGMAESILIAHYGLSVIGDGRL